MNSNSITNSGSGVMDNLTSQNYSMPNNNSNLVPAKKRKNESNELNINFQHHFEVPPAGTLVNEKIMRKAGPYILSPNFRSPIVTGISQYLCKKTNTSNFYTIKILPLKNSNETNTFSDLMARELLHSEYSLLTLLNNVEGVVKVHELFKDYALEERLVGQNSVYTGKVKQRICMVLDCYTPPEYCTELVNLQHYVIQQKRLPEKQAITIFHNILHKVEELHNHNVVHRDLKLGNFLYNRTTHHITLFNFGLGKHLPNENFLLSDQKGSPAYISPDVISGKPYTGKPSDMWALGVLLYAMLYGQFPFHDTKSQTLFDKIRAGDYTIPVGENISILTVQLIRGLLTLDPAQRFTAKRAIEQVALIVSEFKGPSRDDTLQVVPDINDWRTKQQDDRNYDRSQYSHRESDNVVKINLFSVKQYETTLRQVGSQIPVQKIFQDARAITPSEMIQFTQLLQRIPHTESPLTISMTRNESRVVPEAGPSTSGQQYVRMPRQRGIQVVSVPSELVPDCARFRIQNNRRMRHRERERQTSVLGSQSASN